MTAPTNSCPDPATGDDVQLCAVVGSTAYGIARRGSDIDRLGVFIAPTRSVLGLGAADAVAAKRVTTDPDVTLHELGKYCLLALTGNPGALELLHCDTYQVRTETGDALIANRDAFLSSELVRSSYLRYATHQARSALHRGRPAVAAVNGDRVAKHARHCARLLHMAEQLLTTGTLTLDLSEHRDELYAAGDVAVSDPDAFEQIVAKRVARLETMRSVLGEHPDVDRIDALVVDARLRELTKQAA